MKTTFRKINPVSLYKSIYKIISNFIEKIKKYVLSKKIYFEQFDFFRGNGNPQDNGDHIRKYSLNQDQGSKINGD